jgi:hypothetical protein
MKNAMNLYHAIIINQKNGGLGHRVTILASSLDDAKKLLELQYGKGNIMDLHNKEEASKPR